MNIGDYHQSSLRKAMDEVTHMVMDDKCNNIELTDLIDIMYEKWEDVRLNAKQEEEDVLVELEGYRKS